MFHVYIVYSTIDKEFYIGYTTDLKRRLTEHLRGKTASTKSRKELKLIFSEMYINEKDARRREDYFKTTKGKRTLRLMLKYTLEEA